MGTLGGEEAFFLEGAGGGFAVEEMSEDGLGLAVTGAGGDLAGDESEELSVTVAGEDWALEILACRIALVMRSERDRGFSVSLLTITSPTISTSSVTVCSRSLAGEGFWGLGIGSSTGVGGVDSR